MSSVSRNGGDSAVAPCVLTWRDMERMVAAVVEQRQRLTERTERRNLLSHQLSRALEAQKLRAEKEEDAEEVNIARASLMKRIHESHQEAASSRHRVELVKEQLVVRRKDLQGAAECARSASARLQEAEDLLEAHGERLARRLGLEVKGLRASAIADLDIVFPIRDLSGRRPPIHQRRATSFEGASDTRSAPGSTPDADEAQAQAREATANSRGGPPNGVGGPHSGELGAGAPRASEGRPGSPERNCPSSGGRTTGVFESLAVRDDEWREEQLNLQASGLHSQLSRPGDSASQQSSKASSRQGRTEAMQDGQKASSIPRAASQGVGEKGPPKMEAVAGTRSEQGLGEVGSKPSALARRLDGQAREPGSGALAVCGLQLLSAQQLRKDGLANEAQRQQQAAALGMCAQMVVLATRYGGLTLRYPITWRASRSLIRDPHPPASARVGESFSEDEAISWPLFPEAHCNLSKCSLAMVLLAKDVAQILDSLGIEWVGDKHAILRNLSELISCTASHV